MATYDLSITKVQDWCKLITTTITNGSFESGDYGAYWTPLEDEGATVVITSDAGYGGTYGASFNVTTGLDATIRSYPFSVPTNAVSITAYVNILSGDGEFDIVYVDLYTVLNDAPDQYLASATVSATGEWQETVIDFVEQPDPLGKDVILTCMAEAGGDGIVAYATDFLINLPEEGGGGGEA